MELLKTFFSGVLEVGMFFTFGVPAIIIAIAAFILGFQEGNILSFKGRANRKSFILKTFLILFVGTTLVGVFGMLAIKTRTYIFTIAAISLFFGMLIAYYANMVRRLHNINQSGWWALLFLILSLVLSHEDFPLNTVCPIILVILAVVPGTKGVNRFGADSVDLIRDS